MKVQKATKSLQKLLDDLITVQPTSIKSHFKM